MSTNLQNKKNIIMFITKARQKPSLNANASYRLNSKNIVDFLLPCCQRLLCMQVCVNFVHRAVKNERKFLHFSSYVMCVHLLAQAIWTLHSEQKGKIYPIYKKNPNIHVSNRQDLRVIVNLHLFTCTMYYKLRRNKKFNY